MSFTKYSTTVDFEGIKIDLPPGYKYICRDKFGFVYAWVKRPVHNEFGAGDGSERPLRLGHQSSLCELEPILRQYRMKASGAVCYLTGAVREFK
ncbi:hypothetical protein LGFCKLCI_00071 [Klebsiella phage vB_KpnM_SCNJ1-Y]|nr:hypothetical protein LGFCKLCI_00071 [Klebsiella phage vB_KpnM_SCNJ1-Y]